MGRWNWADDVCRYQRAFVDFFEDQLVAKRYDWKALLEEYMFEGGEPLINGLVSGCKYEGGKCGIGLMRV